MLQNLSRLLEISVEIVRDREPDPVLSQRGTDANDGMPRVNETVIEPELGLEGRGIAQDIHVFLPGISVSVGGDGGLGRTLSKRRACMYDLRASS